MEIRNQGTGDVRGMFGSPATDDVALAPGAIVSHTVFDPAVRVVNRSGRQANIGIEARNADGYSAKQTTAANPSLHRIPEETY